MFMALKYSTRKITDANRVLEFQRLFQAKAAQPLWMRHPRSKFIVYPFWALFTVSLVQPLYYAGRAVAGIKEEK
ncbi:hypothetical protein NADFUDRAFT_52525 [Nadsonia fulvescens var. elongata DSM 6958]|uniref:Uncharacterized protein n=1 Tax=Nadsonia fulvescens var. elongata DSM 6958 TaxID=857566 RepID=A0A1E3PFK4_9ASCO|nr:hypothetical protein NADFUDRAFT_52525 [Nadsonia fulvescens var. elongata DSM 6958]